MKSLITGIILSILLSVSVYGQNFKVGGGASYATDISTVGFFAGGLYKFSDKVEADGYFTYFLEKDNLAWYAVDVNAHYVFSSSKGLDIYGIGGLNITFFDLSIENEVMGEFSEFADFAMPEVDLDASGSDIGFNIGAGVRKSLSKSVDLMGEAKYTLGGANYLNVKVGVLFGL